MRPAVGEYPTVLPDSSVTAIPLLNSAVSMVGSYSIDERFYRRSCWRAKAKFARPAADTDKNGEALLRELRMGLRPFWKQRQVLF